MSHSSDTLQIIADAVKAFSTSMPLNPIWPFPTLASLHALRVTIEYHRAMTKQGHYVGLRSKGHGQSPVTWLHGVVAVSLLIFSGSTIVGLLTATPAPWLLSDRFVGSYWVTYLAFTYLPPLRFALDAMLNLSGSAVLSLDLFLLLIDSISRSSATTAVAIDTILFSPSAHQSLKGSWIAILIIGTLGGAMGGTIASTFGLFSPHWGFRIPPSFGRGAVPANVDLPSHVPLGGISWDLKAPFVVALLYSVLIHAHESFRVPNLHVKEHVALLPPDQAKVVCIMVMFGIFAARRLGYLSEGIDPADLKVATRNPKAIEAKVKKAQ